VKGDVGGIALLGAVVLVVSACGGGKTDDTAPPPSGEVRTSELDRLRAVTSLTCSGSRRREAVVAGSGPLCAPFDSIPAVDKPHFLAATDADVGAAEPIIALAVGGEARAYPVRYLLYHEVVNDVVAGTPVVVTYCPLCDSAASFSRRVRGRTLTFGVSGQLEYANLRMFDRQTLTRWQQITGRAVGGRLEGARLRLLPSAVVSWGSWLVAHPEGRVLAPPSEAFRYGVDPYHGYDRGGPAVPSPVLATGAERERGHGDGVLPPKWRVVGVAGEGASVAFAAPGRGGLTVAAGHARLDGRPLVAFFHRGTALTARAYRLSRSPRGWSATIWLARLDGNKLRFRAAGGSYVELGTGSRFDFFGRGISGPLAGQRLTLVPHQTSFWFAWRYFHPRTTVVKTS
jgi:hypothetical protein